jgi:hypothetical protein
MPDGGNFLRLALDWLDRRAAGAYLAAIIDPINTPGYLDLAAAGDPVAQAQIQVLTNALRGPWDGSRLCGLCDHEFRDIPAAFAVLLPRRDDPGVGVAAGLCDACADGDVREIVTKIWPGLAALDPVNLHDQGGRG